MRRCPKCGAGLKAKEKACRDKKACADRALAQASAWLNARDKALSPGIRMKGETSKQAQIRLYNEAMGREG